MSTLKLSVKPIESSPLSCNPPPNTGHLVCSLGANVLHDLRLIVLNGSRRTMLSELSAQHSRHKKDSSSMNSPGQRLVRSISQISNNHHFNPPSPTPPPTRYACVYLALMSIYQMVKPFSALDRVERGANRSNPSKLISSSFDALDVNFEVILALVNHFPVLFVATPSKAMIANFSLR